MSEATGLAWVVVEHSPVGDTTVGVYSTLENARDVVASMGKDRLESYSIEGHAFDKARMEPVPWQVVLTRDGEVLRAEAFIGCNCGDDEIEYLKRSFIAADGQTMAVIVFALTPGLAIEAAENYRAWLQTSGHWRQELTQLEPIMARTEISPQAR